MWLSESVLFQNGTCFVLLLPPSTEFAGYDLSAENRFTEKLISMVRRDAMANLLSSWFVSLVLPLLPRFLLANFCAADLMTPVSHLKKRQCACAAQCQSNLDTLSRTIDTDPKPSSGSGRFYVPSAPHRIPSALHCIILTIQGSYKFRQTVP